MNLWVFIWVGLFNFFIIKLILYVYKIKCFIWNVFLKGEIKMEVDEERFKNFFISGKLLIVCYVRCIIVGCDDVGKIIFLKRL